MIKTLICINCNTQTTDQNFVDDVSSMVTCPKCGSNDVHDPNIAHHPHWSRKSMDFAECKICKREVPYDKLDNLCVGLLPLPEPSHENIPDDRKLPVQLVVDEKQDFPLKDQSGTNWTSWVPYEIALKHAQLLERAQVNLVELGQKFSAYQDDCHLCHMDKGEVQELVEKTKAESAAALTEQTQIKERSQGDAIVLYGLCKGMNDILRTLVNLPGNLPLAEYYRLRNEALSKYTVMASDPLLKSSGQRVTCPICQATECKHLPPKAV